VANELCTGFSYIVNLSQLIELGTLINRTSDVTQLQSTLADIVQIYNEDFYHGSNKCYDNCGQTSYALSLLADAAPADEQAAMLSALINDIVNTQHNHVTVGIIGAKALFQLLKARQQVQVGIDLVEQTTQPSWGYMIFNDVEPATSNLWELWDSPTEGPGMNSRNHHMFSSVSEFIVTTASGIDEFSCTRLSALKPAQTLGISWADTTVGVACGDMHMRYRRTGGVQCAKVPEGRSEMRPNMIVVEDYVLSCGAEGGVIHSIDFASWGLPDGTCGGFMVNETCDAPGVLDIVRQRCVGSADCVLSPRGTDWPQPSCPGPHRLFVQAKCTGAHGVLADVAIPVGQRQTELWLPHLGLSGAKVHDVRANNITTVFSEGMFTPSEGVLSVRVEPSAVVLSLASGSYSLRLSTE